MDAATTSLLLLIFVNITFLIIIVISFGLIRKCRGDKAKVKLTKKVIAESGFNDLDVSLLDTKRSNFNINTKSYRK